MAMTLRRVMGVIVMAVACSSMASAQDESQYSISLPAGWDKAAFTDGAKIDRVEYIYGDRRNGLLKIKRLRLEPGESLEAVVARDTDGSHRFLPSYVAGKTERFSGGVMSGYMVQFDYSKAGAAMMGRNYYLAGHESTVWVLQFTGERTSLAQLRNETDQIGRSFRER